VDESNPGWAGGFKVQLMAYYSTPTAVAAAAAAAAAQLAAFLLAGLPA
jgi:hypothetical protein